MKQISPTAFFKKLKWLDGTPLLRHVETYRERIFTRGLYDLDDAGCPAVNLVLTGRAKKNFKSCDLILAAFYRLFAWKSPAGNQCYVLANDADQARDDLDLGKKLIAVNPALRSAVVVKVNTIERKDGKGFLEILPAGDVVGTHGKTYLFAGFDEIHGYRTWDILEAMQLDPTRPDALMWITSYASLFHKPGVPLFDLIAQGKAGDPRMLFDWWAADYCTAPGLDHLSPEERANPSMFSWSDPDYLEQQRRRLPAHKFRRLHLNLPGLPEGSAFTAEMVMGAIDRGVKVRPPEDGIRYEGFIDMSHGSDDDAVLAIAHKDAEGRAVLDLVMNQGQRPPFNAYKAVPRFAAVLKEYRLSRVTGDRVGGETYRNAFQDNGIAYEVSRLTASELYEALEPSLNAGNVVLLDHAELESQLLSLVWKGNKITHPGGEHDDYANSAVGVVNALLGKPKSEPRIRQLGLTDEERAALEDGSGGLSEPEVRDRLADMGVQWNRLTGWDD